MKRRGYPSDVSDEEWAFIAPYYPYPHIVVSPTDTPPSLLYPNGTCALIHERLL
jgi:hypothetical protein